MSSLAWILGAFILAIGIIIIVHELGHYAAARWCGVKVLRFSVGFGRPLWRRRFGRDGTEWQIAAFPLGGYVKMLDEREGEVAPEECSRAFNRQSVGRRSLIVLAGPLANLLLAVALYWLLFVGGVEEPRPILDAPPAGTLAAQKKVDAGETVRSVSGVPVATWADVRWQVLHHILDRRELLIETVDERGHVVFHRFDVSGLSTEALEKDPMQALGLRLKRPGLPPVLGKVMPGSPADLAGLRPGDRVVLLEGKPVAFWHELVQGIREAEARVLELSVEREDHTLVMRVIPEVIEEGGQRHARIGIAVREDPEALQAAMVTVRYGPIASVERAVRQTWEMSALSLRMIGLLLTGELSTRNISGPVTIADYAGQTARMGADHYLRYLAVISISIGILNLLPIPILDGGHLMYYLAEAVRGRPLSDRAMELGQQIGLGALVFLMTLALYNDITRLLSG